MRRRSCEKNYENTAGHTLLFIYRGGTVRAVCDLSSALTKNGHGSIYITDEGSKHRLLEIDRIDFDVVAGKLLESVVRPTKRQNFGDLGIISTA
jgi:hypothetical protein